MLTVSEGCLTILKGMPGIGKTRTALLAIPQGQPIVFLCPNPQVVAHVAAECKLIGREGVRPIQYHAFQTCNARLIIDECHLVMLSRTTASRRILDHVRAHGALGLSATPPVYPPPGLTVQTVRVTPPAKFRDGQASVVHHAIDIGPMQRQYQRTVDSIRESHAMSRVESLAMDLSGWRVPSVARILTHSLGRGHKVLLVSRFRRTLNAVKRCLGAVEWSPAFSRLTAPVAVALISQVAMGVNVHYADCIVVLEPPRRMSEFVQMRGRLHRWGQASPMCQTLVQIYSPNTFEESLLVDLDSVSTITQILQDAD